MYEICTCVSLCVQSIFPLSSQLKGEAGGFGGGRASVHKSITWGNTDQTMNYISCLWEETQQKSKRKRKKLTTWWILIGFESAVFPKSFISQRHWQRYSEGSKKGRPECLVAYVNLEELDTTPASSGWMCHECLYKVQMESGSMFGKRALLMELGK